MKTRSLSDSLIQREGLCLNTPTPKKFIKDKNRKVIGFKIKH
jgi:hypothetical protein